MTTISTDKPIKVYTFPGLGIDHRAYDNINFGEAEVVHMDWVKPINLKETLSEYAFRMSSQIDYKNYTVVLVGHSFGGVLSQEIAAHIDVAKIILISSIQSRSENRPFLKSSSKLGLHLLFNKFFTLSTFSLWGKSHGYETKAQRQLFREMVKQQTNLGLKWSLKELSKWIEKDIETKIIQIHGDKDKTFPIKHLKQPDHIIKDGSHFMIYTRAEEVSKLIQVELERLY